MPSVAAYFEGDNTLYRPFSVALSYVLVVSCYFMFAFDTVSELLSIFSLL